MATFIRDISDGNDGKRKQKHYVGGFIEQYLELPYAVRAYTKEQVEEYVSKNYSDLEIVEENEVRIQIDSEDDLVDAFNKEPSELPDIHNGEVDYDE